MCTLFINPPSVLSCDLRNDAKKRKNRVDLVKKRCFARDMLKIVEVGRKAFANRSPVLFVNNTEQVFDGVFGELGRDAAWCLSNPFVQARMYIPVVKEYDGVESPVVFDFRRNVSSKRDIQNVKDTCAKRVVQILGSIKPHEYGVLFNACKEGSYINQELFEAIGSKIAKSKRLIEQIPTKDMPAMIENIGVLWYGVYLRPKFFPSFAPFVNALVVELGKREQARPTKWTKECISSSIHGLGYISKSGELELVPACWELVDSMLDDICKRGRINKYSPEQVSRMILGLGHMRKPHEHENVMEVLSDYILSNLKTFSAVELSKIVHALALMRYDNARLLNGIGEELKVPSRLHKCRENYLALIVYGFSKLDYKNERVLRVVSKEIGKASRLHPLKGVTLSNIVLAFAQLGHNHPKLMYSMSMEIKRRREHLPPKALANFIHGFSQLRYDDKKTMDLLSMEILKPDKLMQMGNGDVSNIVYGFARLGYNNVEMLNALSDEILRPQRLSELTGKDMANIVYGFGKLGYKNDTLIGALSKEVRKPNMLDGCDEQDFVNIAYGFNKLGHKSNRVLDAINRGIKEARSECA